MLYREIIAVCSEMHTKHINTLCGQNVEFFMLNLVVYEIATVEWRKNPCENLCVLYGKQIMAEDIEGTDDVRLACSS
jgi:hypothetical protein